MFSFDFLFFFTQAFMKNKVLSLCFSRNQWPRQLLGSAEGGAIPGICRRSASGFTEALCYHRNQIDNMIGYLILQLKKKKNLDWLLSRWICRIPGLTSPMVQLRRKVGWGAFHLRRESAVTFRLTTSRLQEGCKCWLQCILGSDEGSFSWRLHPFGGV